MNTKSAIEFLIAMEEKHEDLLTTIGISSRNPEIFQACEEIRNGFPVNPDSKKSKGRGVGSGNSRGKTKNISQKGPSTERDGESSTRKELETILATVNARKEKTFKFKDIEFSSPLVKSFMKECKDITDLKVEVLPDKMAFKWATGHAFINSIQTANEIKEMLK